MPWKAHFTDGPRAGEHDVIFGRQPVEDERVYYMRLGPAAQWIRVLESWQGEQGCVVYQLESDDTVSLEEARERDGDQGAAYYSFVGEVGVGGFGSDDSGASGPDRGEPEGSEGGVRGGGTG